MSTVSQCEAGPGHEAAAVMLPSDSQVPTAGWPDFKSRLTALAAHENS